MILDHKKRFKDTPHHKVWHEASASEWFLTGLSVAILESMKSLPQSGDMGAAAANEFRRQGVQLLSRTLLNLTEPTSEPTTRYDQNLNFNT